MTVGENIAVTPALLQWPAVRIARRVDELLALVELDADMRDRRPSELSGGQQQRVGVARALAAEPRVMLRQLDEPFGALDPVTRERLQQSFLRIREELALTTVFVTHDMTEALMMGDRIGVMRDGRLLQLGTPHELFRAACQRLRPPVDEHAPAAGGGRRRLDGRRAGRDRMLNEQLALLPEYMTAHLQLALLALLLSTAVSVPLGVAATRFAWLEQPALAFAGVIQTIPSLALLAVMVPVLAALDLQSIGFLPAIVGLTLYGLLPVLRNTVTGIAGVDPALKEAARGVGMTARQQLTRVELPLAMPVIVAGVRTATVWVVGIATLSTPVGATSLGNYIFSGLQTRNYASVLIGCVAAAGLALVLDGLVRSVEVALVRRSRRRLTAALAVVAVLYAYAGITAAAPLLGDREQPVVVGSKSFTEQYILGAAVAAWVERETGRPTSFLQSLGSLVAFDALDAGEVDIYVDYSGTIWANEMGRAEIRAGRAETLRGVGDFVENEHGMKLAATLGFNNTYALAVRAADAERLGLRTISDLVGHAPRLAIGADVEFFARPEWPAVRDTYGLDFREQRAMDASLMYQAAATGEVDVISAYSTDGRITAYDLRILDDDRNTIPPYDAVVLAGARLLCDAPDVVEALARLEGTIDADRMRGMNLRVDLEGEDPGRVAAAFVEELSTAGR